MSCGDYWYAEVKSMMILPRMGERQIEVYYYKGHIWDGILSLESRT